MLKKIFIQLNLILLISISINASGGSVYTRFGIGDLKLANSARQVGLAGTGIAHLQRDYLATSNPASWGAIDLTRFTASLSFTGFDLTENSNSAFYSETDFSGVLIGIPVSNDYGISIVGGLVPYSNVNYEVFSENQSDILGSYTVNYSGNGGLSKVFLGASYTLPFGLRFGASYEYYNGKTDYLTDVQFEQTTDFENSKFDLSLKSTGIGFTVGMISPDFSKFLNIDGISNLKLGATYNVIPPLSVDSVFSSDNSLGFREISSIGFERDIPSRLGVGLSVTWKQNYTFLFDYVNQKFSEFSVNGNTLPYMRDFNRFSLGFEYRHASGRFGSTFDQIVWRAGLSYEESPYYINNTGVDEMAAYAGISFPLGPDNSIDFGFKYGIRGKTDNNLIKENIFAAFITLSFGDLWFVRPDR